MGCANAPSFSSEVILYSTQVVKQHKIHNISGKIVDNSLDSDLIMEVVALHGGYVFISPKTCGIRLSCLLKLIKTPLL